MTEQNVMPELVKQAVMAQTENIQRDQVIAWDRAMTRAFKGIRGGRRVDRIRNLKAARDRG
jgi:hypothetical protein